jgi:glyoxylase-like metal-dependent hydrolase (beta-lactamase superfamily II)
VTPLLIPAENASEWTGPGGNNTWLLYGPEPALIDAGVGVPAHVDAVAAALAGAPLARILITHGHKDHVLGIPALLARWPGAIVMSRSDGFGDERHQIIGDDMMVPAGTGRLRVVETPGHAPDHVCFFDETSNDLYCGDLARIGGTVVIPRSQGGSLRAYLESLRRVRALAPRRLLPGHGPIVEDPAALIDEYIAHRAARDRQILDAIEAGARTPEEIVDRVYVGLSPVLRPAAADSVAAHLEMLKQDGKI